MDTKSTLYYKVNFLLKHSRTVQNTIFKQTVVGKIAFKFLFVIHKIIVSHWFDTFEYYLHLFKKILINELSQRKNWNAYTDLSFSHKLRTI